MAPWKLLVSLLVGSCVWESGEILSGGGEVHFGQVPLGAAWGSAGAHHMQKLWYRYGKNVGADFVAISKQMVGQVRHQIWDKLCYKSGTSLGHNLGQVGDNLGASAGPQCGVKVGGSGGGGGGSWTG